MSETTAEAQPVTVPANESKSSAFLLIIVFVVGLVLGLFGGVFISGLGWLDRGTGAPPPIRFPDRNQGVQPPSAPVPPGAEVTPGTMVTPPGATVLPADQGTPAPAAP
jgi:flagellar basal body-associated protein FliL